MMITMRAITRTIDEDNIADGGNIDGKENS